MDQALIKEGKDCILTGNPGDGKTHVIRVLEDRIKKINSKIEPIYDASTLSTKEILKKWIESKKQSIPFVIAINASILYELAQTEGDALSNIKEAYTQFEAGVVCGEEPNIDHHRVAVFNLGLRSALEPGVVSGVIDMMTSDNNFGECKKCPLNKGCGFRRHADIIKSPRFRDRIQKIFHRIELVGWHVTIRDVQSFFSYLVFWNHSCNRVLEDSELNKYRIENLIYEEGTGNLFKAIRSVFDPALISMPEIDEKLVIGDYSTEEWIAGSAEPNSAIDCSNLRDFNQRKRAFYFFHNNGDMLLNTRKHNSLSGFESFMQLPDKRQIKELLSKLKIFVGDRTLSESSDLFPIWRGFRFDNSSRRIIISMGNISRSEFSLVKPHLLSSMEKGFSTTFNHVYLKESKSGKSLKVDFAMFKLLEYAEQKVPVWALEENNYAKKIWRFIEDLNPMCDVDDGEKTITLCDLKRKEKVSVEIDTNIRRYMSISKKRGM